MARGATGWSWVLAGAARSLLLLPLTLPRIRRPRTRRIIFEIAVGLAEIFQALAAWLDRRPHLGATCSLGETADEIDLFVEGRPEVDVIEFLWASMALFDDGGAGPDISESYRPRWRDLYSVAEARARILNVGGDTGGAAVVQLLPEGIAAAEAPAEACP